MDPSQIKQYRLIGKIQSHIATSKMLEEALQGALRIMCDTMGVEMAVIWYADDQAKAFDPWAQPAKQKAEVAEEQSEDSAQQSSSASDQPAGEQPPGDQPAAEHPNGTLRPFFWLGDRDFSSRICAVGEGTVGSVYATQEPARLLDFKASQVPDGVDVNYAGFDVCSMVCVPFSTRYENLGCIQFINRVDGELFSEEDADTFDIAVMLAAIALDENEQLHDAWEPGPVIMRLRGITREYQNGDTITQVLKGINLDVYEGEFLALLGESGCGKTTLLNIVGGLDSATEGTVSYLDQDLTHATQAELTEYRRANIGFIFQNYNLMPNLNALQNVRLIAELVDDPMDSEEALSLVGLEERLRNYPSQLSGGQQQRVSIARALVKRPRLILADEPTAALDYATSIEVLQVMEEVIGEGTTLVMVTHNEEIARMADRVVRIRSGRTYETTINRHRAHAADLIW